MPNEQNLKHAKTYANIFSPPQNFERTINSVYSITIIHLCNSSQKHSAYKTENSK
jgi:hypothetical protein